MAKLSTKGLTVVALVFSLLAAGLVYSFLQNLAAQNNRQGQPVVVAKANIPARTKLTAEMLKVVNVPAEYVQPGAVNDISKAVGVATREQIAAGEQLAERHLLIGSKAGFAGLVPSGKRAVSVAVTEVTGVGGLVKPGDFVDVIVTFDTNTVGHLSQIFLQNVKVLATNRNTETAEADNAKKEAAANRMTVTLAVSPDEATRLTVAEEKGKIRLALRPYVSGDTTVVADTRRPRDLLNDSGPAYVAGEGAAAPAVQPVAPPVRGIQVIRGTAVMEIPAVTVGGRK